MNITLFGGSFDPPHNAHLNIARILIDKKFADKVWFVPCAQHPYEKDLLPGKYRVFMLKKLMNLEKNKDFSVSKHELEKTTTSYSIETLEYFQKKHPENNFSWLIGSDQVDSFYKWHRYKDILENFTVFVYPRYGYKVDKLHKGMVWIENVEEFDISSTKIKGLLQNNQPIDKYTTYEVTNYIKENNLYKR